jgi:2-C-methyl-D-erythritol 2,4-cyclodiphosphate synthase
MINTPHTPLYRVGMGYDVHKLAEGQAFWLGGIQIEHTHGAVGHSDADVLIHAICDALLGAANLGDIGAHFPDTDQQYKGIDSKLLLARVMEVVREHKYEVANIDSTVCLQTPKLRPHIASMQQTLAEVMKVRVEDLSIKATTTERLGFVGRQEGVSAYAVAMLYRATPSTDTDFQTYNRL